MQQPGNGLLCMFLIADGNEFNCVQTAEAKSSGTERCVMNFDLKKGRKVLNALLNGKLVVAFVFECELGQKASVPCHLG